MPPIERYYSIILSFVCILLLWLGYNTYEYKLAVDNLTRMESGFFNPELYCPMVCNTTIKEPQGVGYSASTWQENISLILPGEEIERIMRCQGRPLNISEWIYCNS